MGLAFFAGKLKTGLFYGSRLDSGLEAMMVRKKAWASPEDRDRCLAIGFNDYLSKPFTPKQFARAVKTPVPNS